MSDYYVKYRFYKNKYLNLLAGSDNKIDITLYINILDETISVTIPNNSNIDDLKKKITAIIGIPSNLIVLSFGEFILENTDVINDPKFNLNSGDILNSFIQSEYLIIYYATGSSYLDIQEVELIPDNSDFTPFWNTSNSEENIFIFTGKEDFVKFLNNRRDEELETEGLIYIYYPNSQSSQFLSGFQNIKEVVETDFTGLGVPYSTKTSFYIYRIIKDNKWMLTTDAPPDWNKNNFGEDEWEYYIENEKEKEEAGIIEKDEWGSNKIEIEGIKFRLPQYLYNLGR